MAERSEYCRQHGLYPEQLDAWKDAFESSDTEAGPVTKAVLANERKKYKRLEKELLRKESDLIYSFWPKTTAQHAASCRHRRTFHDTALAI